jgi:hypothetical protein
MREGESLRGTLCRKLASCLSVCLSLLSPMYAKRQFPCPSGANDQTGPTTILRTTANVGHLTLASSFDDDGSPLR